MRTVPLGLSDADWTAALRALRFRYHKWDLHVCGQTNVLPEALVVSPALHAEAVAVAETFSAVLAKLERRFATEPALLRRLAIPEAMHPLLVAEPERPMQLARYDLHPTPDGRLVVSEFNEDVPGGFNEAVGLPDLLGAPVSGARFRGDLRRAVVDAFDHAHTVALMFATGYSEDLQHSLIIGDWLREAGHETVTCSPGHLRNLLGLRIGRRRIDAAFRYYPGEWFPRLPNFRVWQRHGHRLPLMNPLRRLIRQSKLLFAAWHEPGLLTADELAFVRRHAPYTAQLDPAKHGPMLLADRAPWVLKRAFGRMGDSVVVGRLVTPSAWREAVTEASRRPADWLVQACFDHAPTPFADGPRFAALGVYLVNGRFAGYYSRAAPSPLLTHEALHVATVVEDAPAAGAAADPHPPGTAAAVRR